MTGMSHDVRSFFPPLIRIARSVGKGTSSLIRNVRPVRWLSEWGICLVSLNLITETFKMVRENQLLQGCSLASRYITHHVHLSLINT